MVRGFPVGFFRFLSFRVAIFPQELTAMEAPLVMDRSALAYANGPAHAPHEVLDTQLHCVPCTEARAVPAHPALPALP